MKKLKIKLYCKSMGKIFNVEHIATSDEEANNYCERNNDCGVIAEHDGLIFIANFYHIKIQSGILSKGD